MYVALLVHSYYFEEILNFALKPQMAEMAQTHHFIISSASLGLRGWEALQASSTEDGEPNVDFTSVERIYETMSG